MYDFCFTIPYAFLLALGGIFGYLKSGSVHSLASGLGCAAVLYGLAQVSLSYYHKGKLCKPATAACMLISMTLSVLMQQRYQATGKVFPAAVITGLSFLMSLYYVWNLIAGPVPKQPAKAQ